MAARRPGPQRTQKICRLLACAVDVELPRKSQNYLPICQTIVTFVYMFVARKLVAGAFSLSQSLLQL